MPQVLRLLVAWMLGAIVYLVAALLWGIDRGLGAGLMAAACLGVLVFGSAAGLTGDYADPETGQPFRAIHPAAALLGDFGLLFALVHWPRGGAWGIAATLRSAPAASALAVALLAGLPALADDAGAQERERHQGVWLVRAMIREGQESPEEINRTIRRVVEGDHVRWERDGKSFAGTRFELGPAAEPKAIDLIPDGGPSRGKQVLGIYKFDGNDLTICTASPDRPRPTAFRADEGSGWTLTTFRRAKPDEPKAKEGDGC